MAQKYLICSFDEEEPDKITVILTNNNFDNSSTDQKSIISAGAVRFIKGLIGVEADITHGSIALGIPVDLERAKIDKKLIEELFT